VCSSRNNTPLLTRRSRSQTRSASAVCNRSLGPSGASLSRGSSQSSRRHDRGRPIASRSALTSIGRVTEVRNAGRPVIRRMQGRLARRRVLWLEDVVWVLELTEFRRERASVVREPSSTPARLDPAVYLPPSLPCPHGRRLHTRSRIARRRPRTLRPRRIALIIWHVIDDVATCRTDYLDCRSDSAFR
jgi:hypothetical protein